MVGRYGIDKLYYGLLGVYLVLILLASAMESSLLSFLAMAVVVFGFYRVFSRNYAKRRAENEAFLKLWNPIWAWCKLTKNRIRDCRTKVYHTCPHCGVNLRFPRKKGKHTVDCPRCQKSFEMKVWF